MGQLGKFKEIQAHHEGIITPKTQAALLDCMPQHLCQVDFESLQFKPEHVLFALDPDGQGC